MSRPWKFITILCLSIAFSFAAGAQTNVLVWHKDNGTLDANMHHEPLMPLLKGIARQTGWHVYVEAGSTVDVSTKFKNLPIGDALKRMLDDLNFALVPKTNSPWQLYVFRTTMKNATHVVSPKTAKHVPNELMVKVKPGTDINALAKSLGAKVIGKMDKYGTYLLQFSDPDSTDNALSQLQMDSDVQDVDNNYYFDAPPIPEMASSAPVGQLSLQLSPQTSSSGNVIVGLIDTDVESLGSQLDQFILPQVSVADGTPSDSTITHGTAMAYTILAAIANASQSSSTSVQIQPVDVYGSSETTTSWDVALGVQAAVDKGATVLNLSLGSSGDSSVLADVLSQAYTDGIVSFAAAGNTPIDEPYYPAGDPDVVAVTALGQPGQLASYANYWPDSDMIALPGTGYVFYNNVPWVVTGTSTSTAEATGAALGNMFHNQWTMQQTVPAMINHFSVPKQ